MLLDIRDLEFLSALAKHRHFAKAADACGVSQPAFSMRIKQLETRLETPIVKRGNRFQGLTTEGETILRHARDILEDIRGLEQELKSAKGEITGQLTLVSVPTALAYAASLARRLYEAHPGIRMRIHSSNSFAIQQRIELGDCDVGITYLDSVSPDLMTVDPLYDEHYVVLAPTPLVEGIGDEITWEEAARLPLCLLEPSMQNRRIIDRMFAEIGEAPDVIAETETLTAAMIMACEGFAATILPHVLTENVGALKGTRVISLIEPSLEKSLCLVSPQRRPGLPTVDALRALVAPEGR